MDLDQLEGPTESINRIHWIHDMPRGHSDDGYTASNGVPLASRREKTQVSTVADPLGSYGQGQETICGLFQGQEEGSTAAAMGKPETDAIYFETMILPCRPSTGLLAVDRSTGVFPPSGGANSVEISVSSS